jgi:hypothetical protein
MIYKLLATQISLSTANTVYDSKYVRCANDSANSSVITLANTSGTIGTVTLAGHSYIVINKNTADTLQGNNIVGAPVSVTG